MTEQRLAVRETIAVSPAEVASNAAEQARVLMDIVNKTKCYQTIAGKQYLQVEAWETIGAFNRVHAVTDWIKPIMRDGILVGYDAKVDLLDVNGNVVGSAIMPCYFTENACKGKEGDAKDKACKSAAQTFATSKAYRMNYSYVAILAGYQPTPAEEMGGSEPAPPTSEHWCPVHNIKFFKTSKMKGYAHKIEGTKEWCNEADLKQADQDATGYWEGAPQPTESVSSVVEGERDTTTITKIEHLAKALKDDFDLTIQEQWEELGIKDWNDFPQLKLTPEQAYKQVAAKH